MDEGILPEEAIPIIDDEPEKKIDLYVLHEYYTSISKLFNESNWTELSQQLSAFAAKISYGTYKFDEVFEEAHVFDIIMECFFMDPESSIGKAGLEALISVTFRNEEYIEKILTDEVISRLVELASIPNESISCPALHVLLHIASANTNSHYFVVTHVNLPEMVPFFVDENCPSVVREHFAGFLSALSRFSMPDDLEESLVQIIVEVLKASDGDHQTIIECLRALSFLDDNYCDTFKVAYEAGYFDAIQINDLVFSKQCLIHFLRYCANAVENDSFDLDVSGMESLLSSEDKDIVANTLWVLYTGANISDQIKREAIATGALESVMRLLNDGSSQYVSVATKLAASLFLIVDNSLFAGLINRELVDLMVSIFEDSEDTELDASALTILEKILIAENTTGGSEAHEMLIEHDFIQSLYDKGEGEWPGFNQIIEKFTTLLGLEECT